ncbi:MerR family transcriptional regulator [Georgenia sp. 311]|uniref:MerR family transcriptional regulator n=1 Tax=Georgenia wutianyii TaxID=2585135 RepID=A0ABX5VT54_9MICO|nr:MULTISPECIES: helix-turn-helix transcriptional regulator [Georgenia]QDB80444.1 MerR family transcriptional regulator [Georgenia wutianyii]TNC18353.1 MerR family transcriptional regulator [Georgenia sp. 311]
MPTDDEPLYVISVAAELSGMHPQTLRQYDRLGIVTPQRARGRGRRYSHRDIEALRQVQQLSQDEGINLAGIRRIIELERELTRARAELQRLRNVARARVFAADASGQVSEIAPGRRPRRTGGALVLWRPEHLN